MRHALRFDTQKGQSIEARGVLTGVRTGTTCRIMGAIPIMHNKIIESNPDEGFFKRVERCRIRNVVEILGWYHTHMNRGPYFTRRDRLNHEIFMKRYPGSISLIIDPSKIHAGDQFADYIRIYCLSQSGQGKNSSVYEIKNISIHSNFGSIIESFVDMISLIKKDLPIILEQGESIQKKQKNKKVHEKKRRPERPKQLSDDLKIERFADLVLKLKAELGTVRQDVEKYSGLDIVQITGKLKALKLKQLSLFDAISDDVGKTRNVQAKIALYRIRDSLSKDMRLLDRMINDQYIVTLSELTKTGFS